MKPLSLVLLCLLCVASGHASGPVVPCCLKTSETKVPVQNLQRYYKQFGVCSVEAVQFTTIKNKTICSDPSDPWAQKAMMYLDKKRISLRTTKNPDPRIVAMPKATKNLFLTATATSSSSSSTKTNTTKLHPETITAA
ncbi:fractalkine-like [Arapaima gigas]